MTKEQFYSGVIFSLLGIPDNLRYDKARKLLVVAPGEKNEYTTQVYETIPEGSFEAFLEVFGNRQVVVVNFSACELKTTTPDA
ncbi:MAG: hypothetical protein VB046_06755 [Paludibacter sp.]|nr:hypothetical protein [Paludibacter sp.]